MKLFTCLLDPQSRGISEAMRRQYESLPRAKMLAHQWRCLDRVAVLTAWDDALDTPLVVEEGSCVAVGIVRLDNRSELERLAGASASDLTDLALVLRLHTRLGPEYVSRILGDFSFVVWNSKARQGLAACDALSVKKLYYAERDGLVAFACRAEALARGDQYNAQFLAELVGACEVSSTLTVYDGVKCVPGGTMVHVAPGRLASRQYWSPDWFVPPAATMREDEAIATFRQLVIDAVRSRLDRTGPTWAQLSGGLDSSSVVSIVQWLRATSSDSPGLAGTVTYVDRVGTSSDEREYSNLIVDHWGLRNETIVDPPVWYDQRRAPPRIDQPRENFMFYPREYDLAEIVRQAGARVLLTGQGPDEYLRGSMFFFADWIVNGRVPTALSEMARRAAIGRVSFWELAYRNAFVPLLPHALQLWVGPQTTRLPPWMHPAIVRRYGLRDRNNELALHGGRLGRKYHHTVVKGVTGLSATIGHLVLDDVLDVRHPFLDRRLVEFGLTLPAELTTRPYAGKWVLREAMRGVVPEPVRSRIGKGTQIERHAWSLTAQQALLAPLVHEPMLAELGITDGAKLRAAFEALPGQGQRRGDPHAALQQVLAIEAWLQIRAGRWPRGHCSIS